MKTDIEPMNTNESAWHLQAYELLLSTAIEKRKERISVIELSKKLNYKRSNIYRMESGSIDLKVSTLLNYLHGFGYHLEIVQDKAPADMVVEADGLTFNIEKFDAKKQNLDKRHRLELLRYLLEQFEEDLKSEEAQ